MKITIKIFDNGNEILSKVFSEGAFRLGRSEFCEIVLNGESISRSHVEFRVTESTVYITNMGQASRLKLNGKAVETAEVVDGDELKVGIYNVFVFYGEKDSSKSVVEEVPAASAENNGENGDMVVGEPAGLPENAFFGERAAPDMNPAEPTLNEAKEDQSNPDNNNVVEFGGGAVRKPALTTGSQGNLAVQTETAIESKPLVAKLIFVEGPRQGEEIPLQAFEVSFGRSRKADVFLDDDKLSRIHAKITRVGLGYRIIDQNSRNGTYVNGMRVLEHPLNSYDVIELGHTKIKFLIHDLVLNDDKNVGPVTLVPSPLSQTQSLQLEQEERERIRELQNEFVPEPPGPAYPNQGGLAFPEPSAKSKSKLRIVLIAVIVIGILVLVYPSSDTMDKMDEKTQIEKEADEQVPKVVEKLPPPPAVPKEYSELSNELQRRIEGYYSVANKLSKKDDLRKEEVEKGLLEVKRIHEVIPYYKNSRELLELFSRRLNEKIKQQADEKARRDEKQDLAIYLEDGLEYLKQGEFDRAAESFGLAINLDPRNQVAIKGLKAAEAKVRDFDQIPPERDPEGDKKKSVAELFQKAVAAFTSKAYQDAIDTAEQIRKIELKGDTQYLNEAKQIIDRARMLQKEEFEPFLIQAKEKYAEGDYNASRDLCDEMLKRDPAYEEAKECSLTARKQLNRLAKEAYTHGYILESMNRIEEAKQYWNRAKNYVRPGDDYYNKVIKKLEQYQ